MGTTFEKHYCCSNLSTSSRSVLYTGSHVPDTGMYDNTDYPWQEAPASVDGGTFTCCKKGSPNLFGLWEPNNMYSLFYCAFIIYYIVSLYAELFQAVAQQVQADGFAVLGRDATAGQY